jgi:hypothetical protein
VDLNSLRGDEESLSDLPVRLTVCRQIRDSSFGRGERAWTGECCASLAGSCGGEFSTGSVRQGYCAAAGGEIKGLS